VLKTFSALRFAFSAVCVLCLFGLQAYGQERDNDKDQATEHKNGVVQDWTQHHVVYPRIGEIRSLIAVQNDPRAILSWQAAEREDWHRSRGWHHFRESSMERDWSISLGTGTTAPAMYPAKYTFNTSAAANCTSDFIVFPVNVAGSATQPNLVAFNDLYSGTTGGTGICNTQRQTYFTGTDVVSDAATYWSYNITAGGVVATSPALSLDGTKVAFVETGPATTAHFHVLAWHAGSGLVAGDGVDATNAQNVLLPKSITSGFATTDQAAGSGAVTDLALTPGSGTASDTLSSPFVDFGQDRAYVGNDSGTLFRIINVFCQINCTPGVSPAPSLDTTWGTGGALATGCSGVLTGPVVDPATGNVFVGCSDGKLYGFTSSGTAITSSPLSVGNGTATGGIVDPPIVDSVNGKVYVVSGSSGGAGVLVQTNTTSFATSVVATLGSGGHISLHAPAFNNAYVNSGTSADWLIYEWAVNAADTQIALYGVGFTGSHVMNSGVPTDVIQIGGSTIAPFSPLTEFLNGTNDYLFVSGLVAATPNFVEYNLSAFIHFFPNSFPPSGGTGATGSESGGTTGIVVDNVSASAQASSIYFGGLTAHTAIKLTQAGLN
jgi:hypothetical protein